MTSWAPHAEPRQSPIQSRRENSPGSRIGVAVLGSTGSVGTQTLDVIAAMPDRFSVVALAASKVSPLLEEQSRRHRPDLVAVSDGAKPWAGDGQLVMGNDALLAAALACKMTRREGVVCT